MEESTFNRKPVDFIAEVTYRKTEDGGRAGYAASGYRPHIQIEGREQRTSAEQVFLGKDKVFPGETAKAEIRIIWTEPFEGQLESGTKFELGEGKIVVATGTIIEVTNPELRKKTANNA